jgi:para-aminobenzoate synthetase/4-amino-4-deoxychorismate lyase
MVVDLLRNDLGRIAVPGSVAVPELWQVERHPTLWQLTSSVSARAEVGVALGDVFAALFPSGSVTGAPKVSAMAVISDLERSPRGVYCGAVGLVQPGPTSDSVSEGASARFAVAIRTAVVDKALHVVEYGSGGGITWDSSASAEWDEVLVKTKAVTDTSPFARSGDSLLETMGFDPATADEIDGGIRNLQRHLARLASSAAYFGMPAPTEAEGQIAKAVSGLRVSARVRLVFGFDGRFEVETSPLDKEELGSDPLKLCVDSEPLNSFDVGLFHKTTDRRRYDDRAQRHGQADDVVLINERDEVTETTRANLAVRIGVRWLTPSLDCGLLPGVERASLLDSGRLIERVVTLDQLRRADEVAIFSSLRGWRSASVCLDCAC